MNNGATLAEDRLGKEEKAYRFDGVDDFILGEKDGLINNKVSTYSLWLKSTQGSLRSTVIQTGSAGISINQDEQKLYAEMFLDREGGLNGSETQRFHYDKNPPSISKIDWVYLLIQGYDSNTMEIWIDGEKKDIGQNKQDNGVVGDYPNFCIGSRDVTNKSPKNGPFFRGLIDDIRIYDRALSTEEVTALYNFGERRSYDESNQPPMNTFTYKLTKGTGDDDNSLFKIVGDKVLVEKPIDFETKETYSIRVRSTDQGRLYFDKALTITATDVNDPPTDILLDNDTIAENELVGTVVGKLSLVDDGGGEEKMITIDPAKVGTKLWEFKAGNGIRSSAIGYDGTVYIGSDDHKLYALNGKNGRKVWEFETGDAVRSSPSIGPDGTVYVGSNDRKLYAINGSTGDKLWDIELGFPINAVDNLSMSSTPAIGPDGIIYLDVQYSRGPSLRL